MGNALRRLLAAGVLAAVAHSADAVEGGVGRSLVGAQISPYAGIIPPIPPEPGFSYSFNFVYLDGTIGAGRQTPIAGEVALNLRATFDLYAASLVYLWNTGAGSWHFASVAVLPFDQAKATWKPGDIVGSTP